MRLDEIPKDHDNGVMIPRRRDYVQIKAILSKCQIS
jgi:hypothetical protein